MQSDCYRCGRPIEGQLAFCSACGAPQIRVSRAIEPSQEETAPPDLALPPLSSAVSSLPTELSTMVGIDWKYFLRTAAPLAFLTGMLTVVLPPLGLFILLPATLVWSIARYRRQRPLPLRSGQGAAMGTVMAILSFGIFLFFSLVAIYFKPTEYRDFALGRIHEAAARNPDPETQQMLQWLATPNGLLVSTVIAMGMILMVFLVVGMGSGALAVALGKGRKRP